MEPVCTHTKKQKTISKRHVFLIEKYNEDVRQDEKHVPDLLESIMRPTDPVKEELRQKLFKIDQLGSKIKKKRVCTFQMSGKIPDSTNVAFKAVISTPFSQYLAALAAKYSKNAGFKRLQSLFTLVYRTLLGVWICLLGVWFFPDSALLEIQILNNHPTTPEFL